LAVKDQIFHVSTHGTAKPQVMVPVKQGIKHVPNWVLNRHHFHQQGQQVFQPIGDGGSDKGTWMIDI